MMCPRNFSWVLAFGLLSFDVTALQVDIHGPPGSSTFGLRVTVLPNSNIVVTDPSSSVSNGSGAVYLYGPTGTLISTLTGSTPNDHVGGGGVVVLDNGNYLIVSQLWNNGSTTNAGAVTWGSATTGVSGVVSSSNSIVGTHASDKVGGVTALANGNYVVLSPLWNGGLGAATWGNGSTGTYGAVSSTNSLVGSTAGDEVGQFVLALTNGNYVVSSIYWNGSLGAATFGDGTTGVFGQVAAGNSLVGTASGDQVGYTLTALTNGNYVVASPGWNNSAGAATLGNGTTGLSGEISAANSLLGLPGSGSVGSDNVGSAGVVALTNGNYVVASPFWNASQGAATWGNGNSGTFGQVSATNSLVGTLQNDEVAASVVALSNGNYVVHSTNWHGRLGAVAWGNGSSGTFGQVSANNALIGSGPNSIGSGGVVKLANGNYVVSSPSWNGGFGAVTWADGNTGIAGTVAVGNSLVGSSSNDYVGSPVALANGNYVVISSYGTLGAVTWGNGASGTTGAVSPSNSLVGSVGGDQVGSYGVGALTNGDYVVDSPTWNGSLGSVTWGNGMGGTTGVVSGTNSLVGTAASGQIGSPGVSGFANGVYVVDSQYWQENGVGDVGAITLVHGYGPFSSTINSTNSVLGQVANPSFGLGFDYDPVRDQLVVGRPSENIVTLFNGDLIFESGFE